jgi:hypothetical protein
MTSAMPMITIFKIEVEKNNIPVEIISCAKNQHTATCRCKLCRDEFKIKMSKTVDYTKISCPKCKFKGLMFNDVEDSNDDVVDNNVIDDNGEDNSNDLPLLFVELLETVPADRKEFAHKLITEINFLNLEIPKIKNSIKRHGWTTLDKNGLPCESVYSKLYSTLTTKYQVLVKSFCSLLPPPVINQIKQKIDEFASF